MKASKTSVLKAKLAKEGVTLRQWRMARNAHRNRTYGFRQTPSYVSVVPVGGPFSNPHVYGRRPLERKR